ncbi:hypothetical protein [Amycolatopsis sp. PS_44_ISF1]|uniref:hypothetical protein n=1 Tax=Amycolatopsis sp. PS_44_ISF1 TaxID=2974917 RepID=UPI0028DFA782|nr:hypothetical protein [Amycolatopsis sp. PS_44_ISF1]MDT8913494.1 hypothetical protein [Amycolatopsis sp. PS_44_ISF1]
MPKVRRSGAVSALIAAVAGAVVSMAGPAVAQTQQWPAAQGSAVSSQGKGAIAQAASAGYAPLDMWKAPGSVGAR